MSHYSRASDSIMTKEQLPCAMIPLHGLAHGKCIVHQVCMEGSEQLLGIIIGVLMGTYPGNHSTLAVPVV